MNVRLALGALSLAFSVGCCHTHYGHNACDPCSELAGGGCGVSKWFHNEVGAWRGRNYGRNVGYGPVSAGGDCGCGGGDVMMASVSGGCAGGDCGCSGGSSPMMGTPSPGCSSCAGGGGQMSMPTPSVPTDAAPVPPAPGSEAAWIAAPKPALAMQQQQSNGMRRLPPQPSRYAQPAAPQFAQQQYNQQQYGQPMQNGVPATQVVGPNQFVGGQSIAAGNQPIQVSWEEFQKLPGTVLGGPNGVMPGNSAPQTAMVGQPTAIQPASSSAVAASAFTLPSNGPIITPAGSSAVSAPLPVPVQSGQAIQQSSWVPASK